MMKRPEQPEHDQIKPIICRSFAQIRFYCLVVFLCSDLSTQNTLQHVIIYLFHQKINIRISEHIKHKNDLKTTQKPLILSRFAKILQKIKDFIKIIFDLFTRFR